MKKVLLIVTLLVSLNALADASFNLGFSCVTADKKIRIEISPAGLDSSGYPSDMSASRTLTIFKKESRNGEGQVVCRFDSTEGLCIGDDSRLEVDLKTLRHHWSVTDLFSINNRQDADAGTVLEVKNFLGVKKQVELDMVCTFQ